MKNRNPPKDYDRIRRRAIIAQVEALIPRLSELQAQRQKNPQTGTNERDAFLAREGYCWRD